MSRHPCLTRGVYGGIVRRMMPLFVFGGALISVLVAVWEDHKDRKARKARQ